MIRRVSLWTTGCRRWFRASADEFVQPEHGSASANRNLCPKASTVDGAGVAVEVEESGAEQAARHDRALSKDRAELQRQVRCRPADVRMDTPPTVATLAGSRAVPTYSKAARGVRQH